MHCGSFKACHLVSAVTEFYHAMCGQYDVMGKHPRIAAYMNRVKEKTDPHFTEAHEVSVYHIEFAMSSTGLFFRGS